MKKTLIALIMLAMAGHVEAQTIPITLAAYNLKGVTTSGVKVNKNTVALHPDTIKKYNLKWHQKIYIPGLGVKLLQDKMKPTELNKGRLDVWYPLSYRECRKIGIRKTRITILTD
jgi:3D (Asp-Asp-Asp) domain-containing protein